MIHLITGGQRSGKSLFAEDLALSLSNQPVYLATSRIWDEAHRERIEIHKKRRGNQWTTIEEEKFLSRHDFSGKVVLLDCITLWINNLFFDNEEDDKKSLQEAIQELEILFDQNCDWIIVTNELGLGGHPENKLAMRFNDLQGSINQYIAKKADRVTLIISGLPLEIKNTL
ncbi:bifunctional adenosylcobinamide kinase/adenosylcobinamide-phosphate guanylyltransferase [Labilibaculum sp. A4]|uniref:bifunctional adenosylcobinamide kinase/adenosylcobinamide-phosphate guanylyltransferase n=1 Tax=Labilibaculum euxinus TaxID=2686357 RepID=UPI000F617325|nr:bifunctional adenosylcobinamide kinase/adenosylcobinamide-phosphate guanylyltransferase [Labilibaculum euxinus]MDQ1770291.1 bifunctional adenosylcobinamide kinase/adenosylcobinamide-phosphate guanylyltransferase [Labilibaculum euxinus]MWN75490.1 bifunctional adenosylcobinamide kinase/adenosylcobinamide-phosphate guanylyltransferase [Labilibaculum euxinus]